MAKVIPFPSPEPNPSSPHRVVVVEDQAMLRDLLGMLLRELSDFDYAGETGSAAEGIELCRKLKPDLVVVDWQLPDANGAELVRALRAQLPNTRFLGLSAHFHEHVLREMMAAGAHGFLPKGANTEVLHRGMHAVMEGGPFYCPVASSSTLPSQGLEADCSLTPREAELLRGIASGENAKMIAARLSLNPKTVNNQLTHLKNKLHIQDTAGLVRYAIRKGFGAPP